MKKRSRIGSFFWGIHVFFAILLAIGCISVYLPAQRLSWLSVFGFIMPPVMVVHALFLLFWLSKKSRKAFLSIISLVVCYLVFGSFYQFSGQVKQPDVASFSLMSYNVRSLNKNQQIPITDADSSIVGFIVREHPDLLMIQEAHHAMRRETLLDSSYPHKFVDFEYGVPRSTVINAIYSMYPILKVQKISFPNSNNAALYADVLMNKDTIRIFNVHLQSFKVIPDVAHLQNEQSGKLLRRIVKVVDKQEEQAKILSDYVENSPYPVLLSGDCNTPQFSKVYRTLKGAMADSFMQRGSGFGKTLKIFNFPFRIDYIFADSNFEIKSHTNYELELSDHYPVMATMALKSNK